METALPEGLPEATLVRYCRVRRINGLDWTQAVTAIFLAFTQLVPEAINVWEGPHGVYVLMLAHGAQELWCKSKAQGSCRKQ